MRSSLFIIGFAITALHVHAAPEFSVPDTSAPRHYAQRVNDSVRVTLVVYDVSKKDSGRRQIVIDDLKWIEEFSKILATAVYQPQSHIFAIASPICFYDKDGKKTLEIEVFDSWVRMDSLDYEVGRKTCSAITELLKRKIG